MKGMKEPQAINTVGSPLAPTDASGRQGYALPLMFLLGQGARMALRPLGQFAMRQFAGPNLGIGGKRLLTMGGRKAPPIPAGYGKEQMIFNPTGLGKYFLNSPEAGAIRAVASGSGKIGGAIKKVGTSLAKSPLTVGSLGVMGFNALGPDEQPPQVTEDSTGIKRGNINKNVGDVTGTTKPGGAGGTTVKTDAEKQQINEDRIQETKNKYYKLMGIDKMNKDATYDSLIDASKIIQAEGGDLKGAIKSGSLQSQLISAISKNLDKSSALKKQIDAAVLKSEIEKDIKRSDPDAAINREYKQTQIALGKKKLEGPSAADVMSSATIDGKNIVTSNTLTSVLSGMGRDVDFTFPDDKYQKWEKSNEGKDEIDYLTENYGNLDDGLYVVNKKAFEVRDGSVFQVDLDKITG
jgi:hypothetical protein